MEISEAILAALEKRADDADLPRRPKTSAANNPLKPVYQRPERRTRPTYRDPTGNQAVGNINKEKK